MTDSVNGRQIQPNGYTYVLAEALSGTGSHQGDPAAYGVLRAMHHGKNAN